MSTHTEPALTPHPGVDRFCDAIEEHGSHIAMALLWLMPVLALVVALLAG